MRESIINAMCLFLIVIGALFIICGGVGTICNIGRIGVHFFETNTLVLNYLFNLIYFVPFFFLGLLMAGFGINRFDRYTR